MCGDTVGRSACIWRSAKSFVYPPFLFRAPAIAFALSAQIQRCRMDAAEPWCSGDAGISIRWTWHNVSTQLVRSVDTHARLLGTRHRMLPTAANARSVRALSGDRTDVFAGYGGAGCATVARWCFQRPTIAHRASGASTPCHSRRREQRAPSNGPNRRCFREVVTWSALTHRRWVCRPRAHPTVPNRHQNLSHCNRWVAGCWLVYTQPVKPATIDSKPVLVSLPGKQVRWMPNVQG